MRRSAIVFTTAAVTAAVVLSACSSSKSKSSSTSTSSATGSSTAAASGKTQVGVILPDTTSSTRYTLYDQPLLKQAFDAAGIKSDIQNAQGSTSKQAQIAD